MPITKENIQGGAHEQLIYQCYCGEHRYLRITRFDDVYGDQTSTEYFVHIDLEYPTWKDRLIGIWKALSGIHRYAVGEVILTPEQIQTLLKEVKKVSNSKS